MGVFENLLNKYKDEVQKDVAQGYAQEMSKATATEIQMWQRAAFEKMSSQMTDSMYGQNYIGPAIGSLISGTVTVTSTQQDPDCDDLWTLRMENLDHPAGKASLQELEELWRTRWGSSWVKRGEITDTFYNIAAVRLAEAQKLEMHELSDDTRVYRLK